MTSVQRIPGLPFDITDDIISLVDRTKPLRPFSTSAIEEAFLDPFMAVGDSLNISGPPGCGKTHLAADIIMGAVNPQRNGVALGGLFRFDLDKLAGGPMAVIDGENTISRWNSLIRRKLEAEGANAATKIRDILYLRPSDLGIQDPKKWTSASIQLAHMLAFIQVRFVVIDTMARIWAPDDFNQSHWVQRGLVPFRSACQECGISVLMLSHTKRQLRADDPAPTGPIGTSVQEGQIDGQIIMSRNKAGNGITLIHQKSRRSFWIQQGSKVGLQFRPGFGYEPMEGWQDKWPHECPTGDGFKDIEPDMRSRIGSLLSRDSSREWKTKELATEVGRDERTVRHHLEELERSNKACKLGGGPSTRWRAAP